AHSGAEHSVMTHVGRHRHDHEPQAGRSGLRENEMAVTQGHVQLTLAAQPLLPTRASDFLSVTYANPHSNLNRHNTPHIDHASMPLGRAQRPGHATPQPARYGTRHEPVVLVAE